MRTRGGNRGEKGEVRGREKVGDYWSICQEELISSATDEHSTGIEKEMTVHLKPE